jgi:hypothetical protein
VAASAVVVVGCLAALAAAALASSRERIVTFSVHGMLAGVSLDLGDADVEVARGERSDVVQVERQERYAFGSVARTARSARGGVLHVRSRCPVTVLHSCSVSYRVVVPDNVPVDVRTTSGSVRLRDYHGSARIATGSGDVDVRAFCGFLLQVRAEGGSVGAGATCAPQRLSLRSTSGAVHAIVPSGRYQVDAESAAGSQQVRGIEQATDAPFAIQALSTSGDVLVEARP